MTRCLRDKKIINAQIRMEQIQCEPNKIQLYDTNDMMMEIFVIEDTYFGEWLFSRLKTEAVQMLTTQR